MSRTVLIAGQGGLPGVLAQALQQSGAAWHARHLEGFAPQGVPGSVGFRIEHLGSVLAELQAQGVARAVFGGSLARPPIDPAQIDAATLPLVPRMAQAIASGDDAALRVVIALFEDHGIAVCGAQDIAPEVLEIPEIGAPSAQDVKDIARAREVHRALAALDVGQGLVTARGQVLAIEALPGTDWMLRSLSVTRADSFARPPGGVFFKAPKPGQDRRIDLPTIGPDTIGVVADAGLNGLALEAGGVIVLEPQRVQELAQEAGLWLRAIAA